MSSLINIIGIAFMIERLSHIYITSITVALSRLNSLVIAFRITRTIVRKICFGQASKIITVWDLAYVTVINFYWINTCTVELQ